MTRTVNEVGSALTDLGAALRRDLSQDLKKAGQEWLNAEVSRINAQITADAITIQGLKTSLDAKITAQSAKIIADTQRSNYLNTVSSIKQQLNSATRNVTAATVVSQTGTNGNSTTSTRKTSVIYRA